MISGQGGYRNMALWKGKKEWFYKKEKKNDFL